MGKDKCCYNKTCANFDDAFVVHCRKYKLRGHLACGAFEGEEAATSSRSTGAVGYEARKLADACCEHLADTCTCSKEYWGRKMIDPKCEWCNISKFIRPIAEKVLAL
jgi:hypothetical protein